MDFIHGLLIMKDVLDDHQSDATPIPGTSTEEQLASDATTHCGASLGFAKSFYKKLKIYVPCRRYVATHKIFQLYLDPAGH